jgi:hypothetical protein
LSSYHIWQNLVRRYTLYLESSCNEILNTFGMKFFLLNCGSVYEGLQKASLKVVRGLNEFDAGKRAFEECDGSKILSEVLNILLQSEFLILMIPDSDNISLSSVNSIASLLVTALRSAAGQSEIPFLSIYKYRAFPLPGPARKSTAAQNLDEPKMANDQEKASHSEEFYNDIVDDCAKQLLQGKYPEFPSTPASIEDLVRLKMKKLCEELSYLDQSSMPQSEPLSSNISVRHVQPMAPGKHFVCKSSIQSDPQSLLKRSAQTFRKIMFDQTARMFQAGTKGTVVYDVMDYKVAEKYSQEEK